MCIINLRLSVSTPISASDSSHAASVCVSVHLFVNGGFDSSTLLLRQLPWGCLKYNDSSQDYVKQRQRSNSSSFKDAERFSMVTWALLSVVAQMVSHSATNTMKPCSVPGKEVWPISICRLCALDACSYLLFAIIRCDGLVFYQTKNCDIPLLVPRERTFRHKRQELYWHKDYTNGVTQEN